MSWRQKSFEVLPALSVRGRHLRSSLRLVTVAWMFGVVWMACISGSQMTLFGKLLGFTNRDFGMMAAIGWLAYAGQLISATAIERTGLRKYQFVVYATIHRLIWLAIAAVPLLLNPGRAAVRVFVVVYAIGAVLAHLSMPAWQNWMGDLIPRRIRGRYFAARRLWTIPIQILTVIVAGLILDAVTVQHPAGTPITAETQPNLLPTISILFAVGAVFGTIDVLLFLRLREIVSPPLLRDKDAPRTNLLAALIGATVEAIRSLAQACMDRKFLHYGLYVMTLSFAMTVGAPFFFRNCLENLGYTKFMANVVFMVAGPIAAMLTVRMWGKLIDRWGRRPLLILCTFGVVFSTAGWFLIPDAPAAGDPTWLARLLGGGEWIDALFGSATWMAYVLGMATCMIGGMMWGGIEMARFNILLGFSETEGRSKYIAAVAVFTAIGGFTGGWFGGWLADAFIAYQYDQSPLRVGPFLWNNWHLTFLASSAARALALIWLIGMPDPGAKPFREVVRHIRLGVYNNALPRLFGPVRVWTHLARRRRDRKLADAEGDQ